MKVIEVTTTCQASVREKWLVAVSDEQAVEVEKDMVVALDLIANDELGATVLSVEDADVWDEHDRDVREVREVV